MRAPAAIACTDSKLTIVHYDYKIYLHYTCTVQVGYRYVAPVPVPLPERRIAQHQFTSALRPPPSSEVHRHNNWWPGFSEQERTLQLPYTSQHALALALALALFCVR